MDEAERGEGDLQDVGGCELVRFCEDVDEVGLGEVSTLWVRDCLGESVPACPVSV